METEEIYTGGDPVPKKQEPTPKAPKQEPTPKPPKDIPSTEPTPSETEKWQNEMKGNIYKPGDKLPKKKPSADLSALRDYIRQGSEALEATTTSGAAFAPGQLPSAEEVLRAEQQRKAAKQASVDLRQKEIEETKKLQPFFDEVGNYLLGDKNENLNKYLTKTPAGNDEVDYEKVMKDVDQFNTNGDGNTRALMISKVIARARQGIYAREAEYEKAKMTKKVMTPDDFSKEVNSIAGLASTMKKTNEEVVRKMVNEEKAKIDNVFREAIKPVQSYYRGALDVLGDEFDETTMQRLQNDYTTFEDQQAQRVYAGEITPEQYDKLISDHQADINSYLSNKEKYNADKSVFVQNEFQKRYGQDFADDISEFTQNRLDALRELNIKAKQLNEKLNKASIVTLQDRVDKLEQKRFAMMQEDMLNGMTAYQIAQDKRQKKELDYRDDAWAPKVFGRNFMNYFGNKMRNLGQFINTVDMGDLIPSLESNVKIGDAIEAWGAKTETGNTIAQKELTFGNWFQPNMIAQSLGQILGQQVPNFAVTAGTYALTKNPALAARIGGTMATLDNMATMGQDTYNQMIEKGYTVQEAKQGRANMIKAELALMPLEMFSMDIFVNSFFQKGIANRLVSSTLNAATEFTQEKIENASQDAIINKTNLFDNVFSNQQMEEAKMAFHGTFLFNLLTGGAGGGASKKPVVAPHQQVISDIIDRKGIDMYNMAIEFQHSQGQINDEQLVELKQEGQRIAGLLEQGKQLEFSKPQLQMFVGLSTEIDTLEKRAANLSDKALKETIEKQIKEKKAQLDEIVKNPESITTLQLPNGAEIATTSEGAIEALSTVSAEEAIKSGQVTVNTTDSKVEAKKEEILAAPSQPETRITRKEDLEAEIQTLASADFYATKLESDADVFIDVTDPASGDVSSVKMKAARAQSTLRKKHYDLRKVLDCITK